MPSSVVLPWEEESTGYPLSIFTDPDRMVNGNYCCSRKNCGGSYGKTVCKIPYQNECGHRFCEACKDMILSRPENDQICDACEKDMSYDCDSTKSVRDKDESDINREDRRDTFRPDTFRPDKAALKDIARAHVICPFKCGSTEQIETLQKHIESCERRLVACPLCSTPSLWSKVGIHLQKDCPLRPKVQIRPTDTEGLREDQTRMDVFTRKGSPEDEVTSVITNHHCTILLHKTKNSYQGFRAETETRIYIEEGMNVYLNSSTQTDPQLHVPNPGVKAEEFNELQRAVEQVNSNTTTTRSLLEQLIATQKVYQDRVNTEEVATNTDEQPAELSEQEPEENHWRLGCLVRQQVADGRRLGDLESRCSGHDTRLDDVELQQTEVQRDLDVLQQQQSVIGRRAENLEQLGEEHTAALGTLDDRCRENNLQSEAVQHQVDNLVNMQQVSRRSVEDLNQICTGQDQCNIATQRKVGRIENDVNDIVNTQRSRFDRVNAEFREINNDLVTHGIRNAQAPGLGAEDEDLAADQNE